MRLLDRGQQRQGSLGTTPSDLTTRLGQQPQAPPVQKFGPGLTGSTQSPNRRRATALQVAVQEDTQTQPRRTVIGIQGRLHQSHQVAGRHHRQRLLDRLGLPLDHQHVVLELDELQPDAADPHGVVGLHRRHDSPRILPELLDQRQFIGIPFQLLGPASELLVLLRSGQVFGRPGVVSFGQQVVPRRSIGRQWKLGNLDRFGIRLRLVLCGLGHCLGIDHQLGGRSPGFELLLVDLGNDRPGRGRDPDHQDAPMGTFVKPDDQQPGRVPGSLAIDHPAFVVTDGELPSPGVIHVVGKFEFRHGVVAGESPSQRRPPPSDQCFSVEGVLPEPVGREAGPRPRQLERLGRTKCLFDLGSRRMKTTRRFPDRLDPEQVQTATQNLCRSPSRCGLAAGGQRSLVIEGTQWTSAAGPPDRCLLGHHIDQQSLRRHAGRSAVITTPGDRDKLWVVKLAE